MKFHIMTLFPEMIEQGMCTSITGRAIQKGLLSLEAVDIRDYAAPQRKRRVDDYPYGGGAGMVMQAQPVYDCYKAVAAGIRQNAEKDASPDMDHEQTAKRSDKRIRTIYLTPQGETFTQKKAVELAQEDDLILLCGHYEGIDERVLEEICTDYLSIGDYVLTGGELAAMVVMDAVSRMVPGVLSNAASGEDESFSDGLLEYPQYSRPDIWEGKQVPPVLLSGDHGKVDSWRRVQSFIRTMERRPDLFEKVVLSKADRKMLKSLLKDPSTDEKTCEYIAMLLAMPGKSC